MERRHHSLEDVSRNRDHTTCEPGAKQRTRIAPVKQGLGRTPRRFMKSVVRTSGCHPDNSIASSASANAPNVAAAIAGVLSEIAPVITQLTGVASNFAVVTLANILTNLALV